MGSAYPTIAADALARYARLREAAGNVHFVTGTDEHGEKIAESAAKAGLGPEAHVESVSAEFRSLWDKLNIRFDHYVRTSADAKHRALVQEVVGRVKERGDIYKAAYTGLYCVGCEEFKQESDLEDDGVCPLHKTKCEERSEENYFFRLSKYQEALEELLESNPDFVRPEARRQEVLGWLKDGARDFSISRASVEWGIPIPGDDSQTVYVWFDALLGYVSALLPDGEGVGAAEKRGWPADVHIVGKDILRFHCVYWPAMLMSAGLPLPGGVYGHGFLTKDGLKMGKSLGNVLDPVELVDTFGADRVRYFFLKEIDFGSDGDFSEVRFIDTVNADLANDVGNCLNRTLNLLKKNCSRQIPVSSAEIASEHPVRAAAEAAASAYAGAMDVLDFNTACVSALSIAGQCNLHLSETEPWKAFKGESEADKSRAEETLVAVLECMRILAILLGPMTPTLAADIYIQLGFAEGAFEGTVWADTAWGALEKGHATSKPVPLITRLEKN
jgi:methionyl-tRNA synthetase